MVRFLAEAGKILNSSLDYNTTLASVANLVITRIADFCAIDLVEKRGKIQRVTVKDADPKKKELVEELYKYPPDPKVKKGVYEVVRTGESILIAPITNNWLKKVTMSGKDYQNVKGLGFTSQIFVPLRARERIIGVLTMASRSRKILFSQKDLILAQELADRAAIAVDNAKLYQEAKDAVKARDEFLSIASHEFKTPLTSILLQTQSVLKILSHESKIPLQKIVKTLKSTESQAEKLAKLIDDLLNVSLITTGRLHLDLEELELSSLTRDLIARFKKLIEKEGYTVKINVEDSPLAGFWDKVRIEQVLSNLLTNAIKYGQGKPIIIKLRKNGTKAQFVIADRGIGIKRSLQKYIFDRFARGVSARKFRGLGVGLYISNQIVEAHGGRIRLKSTEGKGSTFTVELPFHK